MSSSSGPASSPASSLPALKDQKVILTLSFSLVLLPGADRSSIVDGLLTTCQHQVGAYSMYSGVESLTESLSVFTTEDETTPGPTAPEDLGSLVSSLGTIPSEQWEKVLRRLADLGYVSSKVPMT